MKFIVEQLKEKTLEQRLMAVQNYRLFQTTTKHDEKGTQKTNKQLKLHFKIYEFIQNSTNI